MTFLGTSIQLTQLPRPHPSQGIYKALTGSPDCPHPRLQTCVNHDFIHTYTHTYGTMKKKIYIYTHMWEPQFDFSTFNFVRIQKQFSECKRELLDFPGGTVNKNPPSNAGIWVRVLFGKIPHATKQLQPCAMTTEPAYCNYGSLSALEPVLQKRSPGSEKPVQLQLEGNRCLLQPEKPLHSNKGLVWPKNKQINIQKDFQKDSLYFMLGCLFRKLNIVQNKLIY